MQGGRWSDSRALSCVERFDTFSQYWTTVSSLHQARNGLGVAVVGGMIYAIGGKGKELHFWGWGIGCSLVLATGLSYYSLSGRNSPRDNM